MDHLVNLEWLEGGELSEQLETAALLVRDTRVLCVLLLLLYGKVS